MDFSERLKNLRDERGYTQEKLADVLHVTKNSISHYERNISMPTIDVLIAMANVFNVTMDYLLCRTDHNLPDRLLKKPIGKNITIGKLAEKVANLDASHKTDLLKALYYIEEDNKRNKS